MQRKRVVCDNIAIFTGDYFDALFFIIAYCRCPFARNRLLLIVCYAIARIHIITIFIDQTYKNQLLRNSLVACSFYHVIFITHPYHHGIFLIHEK